MPWQTTTYARVRELRARLPERKALLRIVAALAGLLALWLGCDLTNRPLNMGGPMNLAFNPLGIPLLALGILGMALAPACAWVVVWSLAAVLTIAIAGANLWVGIPIEDGAFQSLRAGVPDPVSWPAPAYLHALAFAPVGVAVAALLPGSRRVAPLVLGSAVAAVGSSFGLAAFADAMLFHHIAPGPVLGAVVACVLLVGIAARDGRAAGKAFAGQAAVLTALCLVLWIEYARQG